MEVVSLSGLDRESLFASDLYIEFRVQMGLVDRRQVMAIISQIIWTLVVKLIMATMN